MVCHGIAACRLGGQPRASFTVAHSLHFQITISYGCLPQAGHRCCSCSDSWSDHSMHLVRLPGAPHAA